MKRYELTATTVTDSVTGIQYAVFAGGYMLFNNKEYIKSIEAFSMTSDDSFTGTAFIGNLAAPCA